MKIDINVSGPWLRDPGSIPIWHFSRMFTEAKDRIERDVSGRYKSNKLQQK